MTDDNSWIIYCDGTALPNPGRMAVGAVLIAPDGLRHTLSKALGENGCNNEAEARALIAALTLVKTLGPARGMSLRIHSDSSILVAQLDPGAADPVAPIARLAPVFDEARALLGGFRHVDLYWLPRHRNADADTLARAALGLPCKAHLRPRPKKRYAR